MSFHDFVKGARVLGSDLASCARCGTLRVAHPREGETVFIRRARDEAERVTVLEPPCLSRPSFVAPW